MERETESGACKSHLSSTSVSGLARSNRTNGRGSGAYVQDGEFARLERQNRKQGEADDEAGQSGYVEGTEDEEAIPPTHCRGKGNKSLASIPVRVSFVSRSYARMLEC